MNMVWMLTRNIVEVKTGTKYLSVVRESTCA